MAGMAVEKGFVAHDLLDQIAQDKPIDSIALNACSEHMPQAPERYQLLLLSLDEGNWSDLPILSMAENIFAHFNEI